MKKFLFLAGVLVLSTGYVQSSNSLENCPNLQGKTLNTLGWHKFKIAGAEWDVFQNNNEYNDLIGKKTSEFIEGGYVYCGYQKILGVSVIIRSNNHPALKKAAKESYRAEQYSYRSRISQSINEIGSGTREYNESFEVVRPSKPKGLGLNPNSGVSEEKNIKPKEINPKYLYRSRNGSSSSSSSSSSWQ